MLRRAAATRTRGIGAEPHRGAQAGIIKAAASYPLLHPEGAKGSSRRRRVQQRATGAPITVVGRHEESRSDYLDSLRDAGADHPRCSLDHLDLRVERTEDAPGDRRERLPLEEFSMS